MISLMVSPSPSENRKKSLSNSTLCVNRIIWFFILMDKLWIHDTKSGQQPPVFFYQE